MINKTLINSGNQPGKIVKKLSTLTTEGKVMHSSGSRDLPSLGLSGKSVQAEDIN